MDEVSISIRPHSTYRLKYSKSALQTKNRALEDSKPRDLSP